MTIDEIMELVNQQAQKIKTLEQKIESLDFSSIEKLEAGLNECIKFDKRLIESLEACEKDNDLYLLPSGEYHGKKI